MESFNVHLPPTFHFTLGASQEEKDREIEEYLKKLARSVETEMKKLYVMVA